MSLFSKRSQWDFETLAASQEKNVYLTCLRMVHNPEDALDCAQDTMLKAYRAFGSYRGDSQFSTWISRIATNVCLDFLRKRKKNLSLDDMQEEGFDVPDEKASVYSQLEQQERLRLLRKGIQTLPPDMKAVIILRDMEGRSMEEISQILSLPQGTVKSRLNRARNKLCKILSENAELFGSVSV